MDKSIRLKKALIMLFELLKKERINLLQEVEIEMKVSKYVSEELKKRSELFMKQFDEFYKLIGDEAPELGVICQAMKRTNDAIMN